MKEIHGARWSSYPKILRESKVILHNVLKYNKIIKERYSADTAWDSC